MSGSKDHVFLVSCVSKKKPGRHASKDLYCSSWFLKARCYVESRGGRWYILSAKYGLLNPEKMIGSYDVTLMKMKSAERKVWASRVLKDLLRKCPVPRRVTIFAGQRYREYLVPPLEASRYRIEVPLRKKGIGKQLQWFKRNT